MESAACGERRPTAPEAIVDAPEALLPMEAIAGPRLVSAVEALAGRDACRGLAAKSLTWLLQASPATLALFYTVDHRLRKFTDDVIVLREGADPGSDLATALLGYGRRYHDMDPFAPGRFAAVDTTVIDSTNLPERATLSRSPYFSEFLRSLGMAGQTTMLLRADGRITAGIDLLRPPGVGISGGQLALLRTSHSLLEHAYGCALRLPSEPQPGRLAAAVPLTRREAEVVRLVGGGATNREAAKALMVSEATVKTHLTHAFEKLGVRTRAQLIALLVSERDTPLRVA
jgi:DNA-binding CsgD family transcriptional regulator